MSKETQFDETQTHLRGDDDGPEIETDRAKVRVPS